MESRSGFQGCIASLETNGELTDAINHALVPSVFVEEGCEGEAFFPCVTYMKVVISYFYLLVYCNFNSFSQIR